MKKILILSLIVLSCSKAKPKPSREDSTFFSKEVVTKIQKANDSLQAIKDSIPITRSDAEREQFWANLKRKLY